MLCKHASMTLNVTIDATRREATAGLKWGLWEEGGPEYPRTATLRVSPEDHCSYCDAYSTRENLESLLKSQIGDHISLDNYDGILIVPDDTVLSHHWRGFGSFLERNRDG